MSLINEALKKAQHQRTGNALDAPPMPGGAAGGVRGRQGMPTQTLVLLIAGAVGVIAVSVVATVYFVNRNPAAKVAAVTPAALPPVAAPPVAVQPPVPAPLPATAEASSPVIIAPVIVKASSPTIELPAAIVAEAAPTTAAPAAATTETPAPEPVPVGSLEDRIGNFVDKARVTGIRTSETDSKVLMNDHVYRVNDVVSRTLGLRLVKIASDSLTFEDAKGATYVKNF